MTSLSPRVIHDLLEAAAADVPHRVAFFDENAQRSYAEVYDQALGLAAHLVARGVTRGDRVLLFLENSVDAPIALFAVLLAGGVYTFVNPQTKQEKLAWLLSDAAPRAVVTELALAQRFSTTLSDAPSVRCVIHRDASLGGLPASFESWASASVSGSHERDLPRVIPLDLAAIIYTSGSTGRPKGVMMNHQSMMYSIGALVEVLRLEPGLRTLTVLPFSFNYGMYQMLLTVASRGTLRIEASFAFPAVVLGRLNELEIQVFPGVPTMFSRLASIAENTGTVVPSVLRTTNTAAALSEPLAHRVQSLFPNALIFRMYGLTECKRALYLEPELGEAKPGSVGKAMPGSEVFLRNDAGEDIGAGEPGILHVRGPGVMLGYWNLPEESARVLETGRLPGERVFVTGDRFRCDSEGFYYFLDRSDDIIKTRGEKVSPAEVEAALSTLAGVREAAVVGVLDEELGKAVEAHVVIEPGAGLTVQAIKRHCLAQLEPFMVPRDIVFHDELPRTDTGKIDKRALV